MLFGLNMTSYCIASWKFLRDEFSMISYLSNFCEYIFKVQALSPVIIIAKIEAFILRIGQDLQNP